MTRLQHPRVHAHFIAVQTSRDAALQALSEGSAALGQLPREVRQQVDAHRKAGGVQHLLDLLRQIQVKFAVGRDRQGLAPGAAAASEVNRDQRIGSTLPNNRV